MWGPKECTFFDVFLKAFNKNTSITNFHPLGSTSKPLSRSKEPYRRKGKTQLDRQMSLLVSKPTRNFPPNLHWPKAKTTILHLPSKFKNLVLIQNLKKTKNKKQWVSKVNTLHNIVELQQLSNKEEGMVPESFTFQNIFSGRRMQRYSEM